MGHCLRVVTMVIFVGLYITCYAGGNPEDALLPPEDAVSKPVSDIKARVPQTKPLTFSGVADWVYEASDWVLNLYILHKGSRSQGSHGVLLFEGREVAGKQGEIRALPIGTVQYNGPASARANLWDDSGWQMKDPLVKPNVNRRPGDGPAASRKPDMESLEKDLNTFRSE